ncbi:MAG: ankyrin repeat domain-containing protein [Pyrinomonadaceae bacterium]
MDTKFHPAIAAINAGDLKGLKSLVSQDPTLATSRSSQSHPTLLQCLVLAASDVPNKVELARVLIDAGAELNGPLGACGSCNNVEIAALLLDCGSAINGTGGWSPLEEALYWNSQGVIDLLLQRGASIANLRIAAGVGRTDLIESFFNTDGSLKPEAGKINWPWGDLGVIAESNFDREGKAKLAAKFASWSNDRQSVIDNALVYACMHGHIDAAKLLLEKGAHVNAIPGGFDYSGAGLHYASLNGHRAMAEFLIQHGADVNLKDTKVGATPAGWADYGGHQDLKEYLEGLDGAEK